MVKHAGSGSAGQRFQRPATSPRGTFSTRLCRVNTDRQPRFTRQCMRHAVLERMRHAVGQESALGLQPHLKQHRTRRHGGCRRCRAGPSEAGSAAHQHTCNAGGESGSMAAGEHALRPVGREQPGSLGCKRRWATFAAASPPVVLLTHPHACHALPDGCCHVGGDDGTDRSGRGAALSPSPLDEEPRLRCFAPLPGRLLAACV